MSSTAEDRGWGPGWPNCQLDKLVLIEPIPGKRFTVRAELADLFTAYIARYDDEVEDIELKIDDGCFNCRPQRGTEHRLHPKPSNHSWGMAIDFNTERHPLAARGTFDAPELLALRVLLATPAFQNMQWGGDYRHRADEMHHEYLGTPADAIADSALLQLQMPAAPAEEDDDVKLRLVKVPESTTHTFMYLEDGMTYRIAHGAADIQRQVDARRLESAVPIEETDAYLNGLQFVGRTF
jgi:hypothetical protein